MNEQRARGAEEGDVDPMLPPGGDPMADGDAGQPARGNGRGRGRGANGYRADA